VAGQAHPVDIHVGERIRLRRTMLGVSRQLLGKALDVHPPQMMKYEAGVNRVSASSLLILSRLLDVPIDFFFVGLDGKYMPPAFAGAEEFSRGGARRLVRAYCSIANPEGRAAIRTLVVAIADALEKRPRDESENFTGSLAQNGSKSISA
jgi:transcriptional regulator with XRE-family HTH domain